MDFCTVQNAQSDYNCLVVGFNFGSDSISNLCDDFQNIDLSTSDTAQNFCLLAKSQFYDLILTDFINYWAPATGMYGGYLKDPLGITTISNFLGETTVPQIDFATFSADSANKIASSTNSVTNIGGPDTGDYRCYVKVITDTSLTTSLAKSGDYFTQIEINGSFNISEDIQGNQLGLPIYADNSLFNWSAFFNVQASPEGEIYFDYVSDKSSYDTEPYNNNNSDFWDSGPAYFTSPKYLASQIEPECAGRVLLMFGLLSTSFGLPYGNQYSFELQGMNDNGTLVLTFEYSD